MVFDILHIRLAIDNADSLPLHKIHHLAAARALALIIDILLQEHWLQITSTADIDHLCFSLLWQIMLIKIARPQQLLEVDAASMALIFGQD